MTEKENRGKALAAALIEARTGAEIVGTLFAIEWNKKHETFEGEPPAAPEPPPLDALATWLCENPPDTATIHEAEERLAALELTAPEEAETEFRTMTGADLTNAQIQRHLLGKAAFGKPTWGIWEGVIRQGGHWRPLARIGAMVPKIDPESEDGRFLAKEGIPETAWPTDSIGLEPVHAAWRERLETKTKARTAKPLHPLAPLIRHWISRNPPTFEIAKSALFPGLGRITESEAAHFPTFFPDSGGRHDVLQPMLPMPELEADEATAPPFLLDLYDRTGGESKTLGHAPLTLRLFVMAASHVPAKDRTGAEGKLRIPTKDVIQSLHPNGWHNIRRDWHNLPEALERMVREMIGWIHVPGYGRFPILTPDLIPQEPTDPFVGFRVRIPASAKTGARLDDWPRLCRYGLKSARLYRAYLAASIFLDRSAHQGHQITRQIPARVLDVDGKPIRGKGGKVKRDWNRMEANPAARFAKGLTDADLARMIGSDPDDRSDRERARKAFKRLHDDRAIDLERVPGGWKMFKREPERKATD